MKIPQWHLLGAEVYNWEGIWSEVNAIGSRPQARSDHVAVWDNYHLQMLVFGGVDSNLDHTFIFVGDAKVRDGMDGDGFFFPPGCNKFLAF